MSSRRDYPSIREYAHAQRELGSCLPEFRQTMVKAVKVGAGCGVPLGVYVAFRQGHKRIGPFLAMGTATWAVTVMTFTVLGLMGGSYNCLRVKM